MAAKRKDSRRRFGSVEHLESGRIRARYRGPDGLHYSAPVTFPTVADADAWLATVQADMVRDVWKAPQHVRETLSVYGWRWIEQRRVRDSTRELYSITFRLHIEPHLGALRLDRVTPDAVRDWHARLGDTLAVESAARRAAVRNPTQATQQTGASTQARAYRLLRSICSTAVEDELLPRNPCRIRGAATYRAAERPTLSVPEVEVLADEVLPQYRALVHVLAWCALRLGEVCELRRRDIDLARHTITVTRAVSRSVSGSGYRIGEPKSDAGRRTVTVPDFVADMLREHMKVQRVTGPDALVFTTRNGTTAYAAAQQAINKALLAIGRPDVRVHDLRHTGQVLAAQIGATLPELKRRLGHSTYAAAATYMHTTGDHGKVIAERLNDQRAEVIDLQQRRAR